MPELKNFSKSQYFPESEEDIPDRDDIIIFSQPKPSCDYYHYSNEQSQGALICETAEFPRWVEREKFEVFSAYQDRLREWDFANFEKVNKKIGGFWEYELPKFSDVKLKEIVKDFLELDRLPEHVRFVYYYNVSSGYGCPMFIAVFKKIKKVKKNVSRKIKWKDKVER